VDLRLGLLLRENHAQDGKSERNQQHSSFHSFQDTSTTG
jgi:hypothetical protein